MSPLHPYAIFPLGDAALLIDFGTTIDDEVSCKVLGLYHQLRAESHPAIVGLVPAYSSITVHYDPALVRGGPPFDRLTRWIETFTPLPLDDAGRLHHVPVCYALPFAPDLCRLAAAAGLTTDEVIYLHTEPTYRVYMIGFLPGFAYMGPVAEAIAAPRLPTPRPNVAKGSVGIAGQQTGIYPLSSPGGWQLIGRTPLHIFDPARAEPVLFAPGDEVKFYSISEDEFAHYQGGIA